MMISPCTLCDMALNAYQGVAERTLGQEIDMPEVNFAQLLGLSLGLDAKSLGMDRLHVSAQPVLSAHGVI
ncbi:MAG: hypothetical protein G8345_17405 [Magnetococcales bacterium]|nr:hypothetical protein [Magnetococcales bacterium]